VNERDTLRTLSEFQRGVDVMFAYIGYSLSLNNLLLTCRGKPLATVLRACSKSTYKPLQSFRSGQRMQITVHYAGCRIFVARPGDADRRAAFIVMLVRGIRSADAVQSQPPVNIAECQTAGKMIQSRGRDGERSAGFLSFRCHLCGSVCKKT